MRQTTGSKKGENGVDEENSKEQRFCSFSFFFL